MKKLLTKLCALTLMLTMLAGCSGNTSAESSPSSTSAPSASTSTETKAPEKESTSKPITLSIAHESNPGEGRYIASEKWKELVEERSGGSITINVYPSSQLGSKADVMEQILMDEPILLNTDGSFLCEYGAPEISIMSMPYVFDDWDQVNTLVESDWFAQQEALLADNGIRVVNASWALGERQLITTKPVYTLADLKGLKIRVPNNTISVVEFECFGATSTPMALGDVYTALQQGTIDGQENPIDFLYNGGYGEVCGYVTLTGHVKMPLQWVMSENVWNSMSTEQQEILVEAGLEAGILNNEICLGSEAEYQQKFRDDGVTVIELDDAALQEFKDAIVPLYSHEEVIADWSDPNLYQTIRTMLAG